MLLLSSLLLSIHSTSILKDELRDCVLLPIGLVALHWSLFLLLFFCLISCSLVCRQKLPDCGNIMMLGKLEKGIVDNNLGPSEVYEGEKPFCNTEQPGGGECSSLVADVVGGDVEITCFTEDLRDATLHFQIIRMTKQIYVWIGCNSAKLGHLYAAATTRPKNMVSVTSLLGGGADNAGSSIARHLVLKTGLNIILACNIPKDNPMLEAEAEGRLFQELRTLGYLRPKSEGASSPSPAFSS